VHLANQAKLYVKSKQGLETPKGLGSPTKTGIWFGSLKGIVYKRLGFVLEYPKVQVSWVTTIGFFKIISFDLILLHL
jgi:hypothetical protein